MSPELNIRNVLERGKRLDCLVQTKNGFVNVEVNSNFDNATKVRNFNYFTSFYSQRTKVGESYDIESKFLHISLNFGMGLKYPNICNYQVYDKRHDITYIDNFEIIEVNIDYYKQIWYDGNKSEMEKTPVLVLLGLSKKEMEDMAMENEKVKEIKEELDKINTDPDYQFYFDQEEADRLEANTREKLARETGIETGALQNKIEVAKNMLLKNKYNDDEILSISNITETQLEELKKEI